MYTCKISLLLFLLLPFFGLANGDEQQPLSEVRDYGRTLAVNKGTAVEISNKYGNVEVHIWEKDSVKIAIRFEAIGKKQKDIDEMLETTSFNIGGNSSYVFAETILGGNGLFKQGVQDLKYNVVGNREIKVNYKVSMPVGCRLNVKNKFGDIFLPNLLEPVRISIEHGDLRAPRLSKVHKLYMKYGTATILQLDEANVELEYGTLTVEQARRLELDSRSSNLHLEKVDEMHITCKAGDLNVEEVGEITGKMRLTKIRVAKVKRKINLDGWLGSIFVANVGADCNTVFITGKSTGIDIGFDGFAPFDFEVQLQGKSDFLRPPEVFSITGESNIDNVQSIKGHYEASGQGNTVFVKSTLADVRFHLSE